MIGSKKPQSPSALNGFLRVCNDQPGLVALEVGREQITYGQLLSRASGLAQICDAEALSTLITVFGYRSVAAYSCVIACHLLRRGYMPLNPQFPTERTLAMLALSGSNTMFVAEECFLQLRELLPRIPQRMQIILASPSSIQEWKRVSPQHDFRTTAIKTHELNELIFLDLGSLAYVLFTSGSTGAPKGVMISHENLNAYIGNISSMYSTCPKDRFSQVHDFTFDPSAHDMFCSWSSGATLCPVPKASLIGPGKFISEKQITVWYSVPSVAALMARLKMLAPGAFPSIRVSLFCGEPLPAASASAWQRAAPSSIVENLYGPTEATVSTTRYTWRTDDSPTECENGIVPIGRPFVDQKAMVADENGRPVGPGQAGELWLSGTQLSPGYWNNLEETAERFVTTSGQERWYRTGDLAEWRGDCLYFLGRMDSQVKIRGYRVELQEIEFQLKNLLGNHDLVAIPWPLKNGTAEGVIVFVAARQETDTRVAIEQCRTILPEYMVPQQIINIAELPMNANGKVDRRKLVERLSGR
jgi:amino acid adenylation domain-containing protein